MKRRPDPDSIPYRLQADLDLETPMGRLLIPIDKAVPLPSPITTAPPFT